MLEHLWFWTTAPSPGLSQVTLEPPLSLHCPEEVDRNASLEASQLAQFGGPRLSSASVP